MKTIFENKYITSFKFESFREFSNFIDAQNVKKTLALNEAHGNVYYCYVGYDSLTKEKLFLISFSSYQKEKDLNFLMWKDKNLFVLDTGANLYFVDDNLDVKTSFEITSPLIGLYTTSGGNLLVLEEASARVISAEGKVLRSELFDLIEEFTIQDNLLSLKAGGETKHFELL